MENYLKKTPVVWSIALLCCILWGSAFPSIKIGYRLFEIDSSETFSQILFAGCRFTLAGMITIVMGSTIQRKMLIPKRTTLKKIIPLGLIQTVAQYLFFYMGLANTTGVKSAIINGLNVFFAILLSAYIFRQEKMTGRKVIGSFFGFLGVVLINLTGNGLDFSFTYKGEGYMLVATVACALASVLIKEFSKNENPVLLNGYQFIFGGLVLISIGLAAGGKIDFHYTKGVFILIYLAFLSATAYSLWSILLKYNPVSKVTIFGFMNPIFGVLLSALLLGETQQAFSIKTLISLMLVSFGIYLVLKMGKESKQTS